MPARRTLGTLGVLALLLVPTIDDAIGAGGKKGKNKRKGRVVRVERTRLAGAGMPRMCGNVRPDAATCYGRPPESDDVGTVVDDTGVKGTVRVRQITPQDDGCGNTATWEVTLEVQSGDLSQSNYNWNILFDVDTTANSRLLYNNGQIVIPSNRVGENLWNAFDHDSDDVADFLVTYVTCDAAGNIMQPGANNGYCMIYYVHDGGGGASYTEVRKDTVRNCN